MKTLSETFSDRQSKTFSNKQPKTFSNRQRILLLSALLACLALFSLSMGRYSNSPVDVINAIRSRLGLIPQSDISMENIVFYVRLPRIFASIFVGAMLSVSGAVYQGTFRNPLVSPDLLGVSSGASVGAAASILLGFGMLQRQIFAFIGGILAVALTATIPKLFRNTSNMMLVLSGIIVGGFLNSVLAIMKFVAEEQTELSSIVFWQMGSVSSVKTRELVAIGPVYIICTILLIALSWRINILSFGEIEAKTLGMNVRRIRGIVIVCASLLTASAVCISGTIGWIGLVIPHLGRLVVGSDHTELLPVTVIFGSIFMLIIDTIARISTSVELPLSILTGFVGAPTYAYLLYRQRANSRSFLKER
ncbi:MAG: iron ABC transporter permease [Natronincolaceae bacterium]|nr:iron ABC transporter permease [Bacillota bacterium]NLK90630.1 iron ABC transporter permease [Clostridiales bacterium]